MIKNSHFKSKVVLGGAGLVQSDSHEFCAVIFFDAKSPRNIFSEFYVEICFNAKSSRTTFLLKTQGNGHTNFLTNLFTALYAVTQNDAKSSTTILLHKTQGKWRLVQVSSEVSSGMYENDVRLVQVSSEVSSGFYDKTHCFWSKTVIL